MYLMKSANHVHTHSHAHANTHTYTYHHKHTQTPTRSTGVRRRYEEGPYQRTLSQQPRRRVPENGGV
jgi:hypothetical protein